MASHYRKSNAVGGKVLSDFASAFNECWFCGGRWPLEIHHIARGCHRAAGRMIEANLIRICSNCHDTVASMGIAAQLALKKICDPKNYDRVAVNRLRGRADEAVTEAEVDAKIAILK